MKFHSKRLLTLTLTLSMLASTAVPAFAADPNEVVDPNTKQGGSNVTIEVQNNPSDVIIATVPVELPIIVDLDGNITVPTNAKIINQVEDKSIDVVDITAT